MKLKRLPILFIVFSLITSCTRTVTLLNAGDILDKMSKEDAIAIVNNLKIEYKSSDTSTPDKFSEKLILLDYSVGNRYYYSLEINEELQTKDKELVEKDGKYYRNKAEISEADFALEFVTLKKEAYIASLFASGRDKMIELIAPFIEAEENKSSNMPADYSNIIFPNISGIVPIECRFSLSDYEGGIDYFVFANYISDNLEYTVSDRFTINAYGLPLIEEEIENTKIRKTMYYYNTEINRNR